MEWIAANWWWIVPIGVPTALGILKCLAKMTKSVEDDKIVTLLSNAWKKFIGLKMKP